MKILIYTDSRGRKVHTTTKTDLSWPVIVRKNLSGHDVNLSIQEYRLCTKAKLFDILKCHYDLLIMQIDIHDFVHPYAKRVWDLMMSFHPNYPDGKFTYSFTEANQDRFWYENKKIEDDTLNLIQKWCDKVIYVPVHFMKDYFSALRSKSFKKRRGDILFKNFDVANTYFNNRLAESYVKYKNIFTYVDVPTGKKWRNKHVSFDLIHYKTSGHKILAKQILKSIGTIL